MHKRSSERGMTWVSFLFIALFVAGVYWAWVFGPVYLDNYSVKQVCATAGNMAYTERNDNTLKKYIFDHVKQQLGTGKIDFEPGDVQLERTTTPPLVKIDVTYSRTITMPIIGGERTLVFADHAEQDLSPVKW